MKNILTTLVATVVALSVSAVMPPRGLNGEILNNLPHQGLADLQSLAHLDNGSVMLKTYGNLTTNDGLGVYGQRNPTKIGAVNTIGDVVFPVILVEFSDVQFKATSTIEKISRQLNEEGYNDTDYSRGLTRVKTNGSVRDFFVSQSGGMFRPTFEVVAKVKLDHPESYYFADKFSGSQVTSRDINTRACIVDAITAAQAQGVDFSKFVRDDNKSYYGNLVKGIPMVSCICAGYSQASVGEQMYYYNSDKEGTNMVWPHYAHLPNSTGTDFGAKVGNETFMSYFVGNELYGELAMGSGNKVYVSYTSIQGPGTFIHEFGHALGLPDFYCTDYSVQQGTPSYWSMMDAAPYYKNGYQVISYGSYERILCGWQRFKVISTEQQCELHSFASSYDDEDKTTAYVIKNPVATKEYYILENRIAGEPYCLTDYGSGMLVTHVNFDYSRWENGRVNNTASALGYSIISAAGYLHSNEEGMVSSKYKKDLYDGKTYKELTDTSTPQTAIAFNGSTKRMGRPIYNIAIEDGVVKFDFLKDYIVEGISPVGSEGIGQTPATMYDLQGRELRQGIARSGMYIQSGKIRLAK